jgi:hypothetical protein
MAGVKHKPESGGIRRNYFRMDGSEGKEMRKVFVSSFHVLEKNRKSRTPMQAERIPSRRNSRDPPDFPRNPGRCAVLSESESDFGPANPRCENIPMTHHPFLKYMLPIEMPCLCRLFPFQAGRFSFRDIRRSLPNKIRSRADGFLLGRIPGVKPNSIPF